MTLADVTLGKSVTLTDVCYEWNTKAEIVHVEAIASVVALTSSSPLTGRFSAFRINKGTAVAQWLRCCATSRKVAGWIPAGVIGIFH